MSDTMLVPRATSALEVPGLVKHVPCNPLSSMHELVRGTASKSRPRMCSEVWVENSVVSYQVCCCSSKFRGSFNSNLIRTIAAVS